MHGPAMLRACFSSRKRAKFGSLSSATLILAEALAPTDPVDRGRKLRRKHVAVEQRD